MNINHDRPSKGVIKIDDLDFNFTTDTSYFPEVLSLALGTGFHRDWFSRRLVDQRPLLKSKGLIYRQKIRNEKGYWEMLETYISDHSEADFSHGICPGCMKKLYPGIYCDLSQ